VTSLTTQQVEGLLFWGWLGGYKYDGGEIKAGRLLTIEELGEILKSTLPPAYHAFSTNITQSRSTSRSETSSTSLWKSTCSRSSRSWKSW
jgi:hypothetical protein